MWKLTQNELAQRIGTTPTAISMYENGKWVINQSVIDWAKSEYGEDIRPLKRSNGVRHQCFVNSR